jgi:hypothetical protein
VAGRDAPGAVAVVLAGEPQAVRARVASTMIARVRMIAPWSERVLGETFA